MIFPIRAVLTSVGSMVVYERGKPKRNDYRKFKIKGVQGADDYASMEEVLTRRFTHGLKRAGRRKRAGRIYGVSGSDPDGRWKGAGKYCMKGLQRLAFRYSGVWNGKRRSSSHKRAVLSECGASDRQKFRSIPADHQDSG